MKMAHDDSASLWETSSPAKSQPCATFRLNRHGYKVEI